VTDPLALAAAIETDGVGVIVWKNAALLAASLRLSAAAVAMKDVADKVKAGIADKRPFRTMEAEWLPAQRAYAESLEAFRAVAKEAS